MYKNVQKMYKNIQKMYKNAPRTYFVAMVTVNISKDLGVGAFDQITRYDTGIYIYKHILISNVFF